MTPTLARRLLGLTLVALTGYGYGWFGRAYGITTPLLFTAVAVTAWLGGWAYCYDRHSAVTAGAVKDRDNALARIAEMEDGQRYEPVPLEDRRRRKAMDRHPSVVSKRGPA